MKLIKSWGLNRAFTVDLFSSQISLPTCLRSAHVTVPHKPRHNSSIHRHKRVALLPKLVIKVRLESYVITSETGASHNIRLAGPSNGPRQDWSLLWELRFIMRAELLPWVCLSFLWLFSQLWQPVTNKQTKLKLSFQDVSITEETKWKLGGKTTWIQAHEIQSLTQHSNNNGRLDKQDTKQKLRATTAYINTTLQNTLQTS